MGVCKFNIFTAANQVIYFSLFMYHTLISDLFLEVMCSCLEE